MTYTEAIRAIQAGKLVSRNGWAPGVMLRTLPNMPGEILVRTSDGHDVPYVTTVDDALAEDWGLGDAALRRREAGGGSHG